VNRALLEVRGLCVQHPGRRGGFLRRRSAPRTSVLDVSFSLGAGQVVALLGESGSGKTTIARALVGLERASAGSARFDGVELLNLSRKGWIPWRKRIQYVFQDSLAAFDPRQTLAQALAEPLAIHRIGGAAQRDARVRALAAAVGLAEELLERFPHELSGGQRQRAQLARALACEPELLVLDEPTSALDLSVRVQIVELLMGLRERFGLALLFITHDLSIVKALASELLVLDAGRIVESGATTQVLRAPQHPSTRALVASELAPDPRAHRRGPGAS
jgi:ABC-type microcin C transport system duplicated ATPase subunit YejF